VGEARYGEYSYGASITVDPQDNIYITGSFSDTLNLGGIKLTANNYNMFIAKYRPNGGIEWALNASGLGAPNEGYGITVDDSSNIYVTGQFRFKRTLVVSS